jgi:Flp pilus assembly protein TadB
MFLNEVFLAVILIMAIPSAVLDYINQKWLNAIEDQMPVLVRGISESQETGVTLVEAFENVVTRKMVRGPLSSEVKRLTIQMSWGLSFENALKKFNIDPKDVQTTNFSIFPQQQVDQNGKVIGVAISTCTSQAIGVTSALNICFPR